MSPAWNPLGVSLGLLLFIHLVGEIGVGNDKKGTIIFFCLLSLFTLGSTMLMVEFFSYIYNLFI